MNTNLLFHTIAEQVAQNIKQDIINGVLEEDTPLREIELSNKYNVSRGPIRDALKILAKEGLIVSKPNVGARVSKRPKPEVLELIISIRRQIEVLAFETCFNSLVQADKDRMDSILKQMKKACEEDDIYKVEALDMLFHEIVIKKYKDKHLYEMWQSAVNRMMFRYNRLKTLMDSYIEHEKILKAIKDGDKDKAISMLEGNIQ